MPSRLGSINFSPRARVPNQVTFDVPLPGTAAFSRVRGREGDLIVVQLSSGVGNKKERRDALRTLGLKGPRSACLRRSSDASTWGNIAKVRDLVAVIELPSVIYSGRTNAESADSDAEAKFEHYKYGSETKPAELWRNEDGDFFGYEFERPSLLAYWSTRLPLDVVLAECAELSLIPSDVHETCIAVSDGAKTRFLDGKWGDLDPDAIKGNVISILIPFSDEVELTWQAPYSRFHDLNTEHSEIGLITNAPDPMLTKLAYRRTASPDFARRDVCRVRTRDRGASKEYPV